MLMKELQNAVTAFDHVFDFVDRRNKACNIEDGHTVLRNIFCAPAMRKRGGLCLLIGSAR